MSKKNILLAITNGFWLIQPEYAHASAGLVQKILTGDVVFNASEKKDNEETNQLSVGCFSVKPSGEVAFGTKYNPFLNASPGSIGVVGISGPIMKYDNCGDLGTKSYSALISQAQNNPNISGLLLVVDSPGGTVDGTQELAQQIKAFSKPKVVLVDGLMASAAYWIGSSADEVIANNETAMIGSIGTMISFADMQPYYEKEGVKFHTIYADASKDKNKAFDEARKGNYDLLKQTLNAINNEFISGVKNNRPALKESALTGKTFMAADAVDQKLIDNIGDFSYALSRLDALINPVIDSKNQNQPKKNMKKVTLMASCLALIACVGASVEAGKDSVDVELSDDLIGKINADLQTGLDAASELASLKTKVAELTAAASANEDKVKQLEASAAEKDAEIVALKAANPGATNTVKAGTTEKIIENEENDYTTEFDEKLAEAKSKLPTNYV